jgi:hypothetical protein
MRTVKRGVVMVKWHWGGGSIPGCHQADPIKVRPPVNAAMEITHKAL